MELGFAVDKAWVGDDREAPQGLLVRKSGKRNDWNAWDGGICGGETPMWLFPLTEIEERRFVRCDKCEGKKMTFILQVYAPAEGYDRAFHRDLCVFFCDSCRSARCLRLQLPRENDYYASESVSADETSAVRYNEDGDGRLAICVQTGEGSASREDEDEEEEEDDDEEEEEDDDDDDQEREPKESSTHHSPPNNNAPVIHGCKVCGTPSTTRCSACKSTYYCTKEHQMQDWKSGNHKVDCKDLQTTQRDVDAAVSGSNAKLLQNLRETNDPEFQKFLRVTRAAPKQILRYSCSWFSSPDAGGDEPNDHQILWMTRAARRQWTSSDKTRKCENCGVGRRKFEFQIVPQVLHFLGLDLSFDSVVVFTCVDSCGEGRTVREELAIVI